MLDTQAGEKVVYFRYRHKKQVIFDLHTRTKSNSIPHTKISQFRRHHCNQVNSIPTLKSSQLRCPDTKTKLTSTQALKPSIFHPWILWRHANGLTCLPIVQANQKAPFRLFFFILHSPSP